MKQTATLLIQTVYKELSKGRVDNFTIVELAKCAGVNRGTIYYNFETIENIYQEVFEKIILKEITTNSNSFEDLIKNFIEYVNNNKIFCLNLYYQTAFTLRHANVIDLLNDLLVKYTDEQEAIVKTELITGYIGIIEGWFNTELLIDSYIIQKQLLKYHVGTSE